MRLSLNIDIAQPIILFILWIAFKLYNRRRWVKLDTDFTELAKRINSLAWRKRRKYVPNGRQSPPSFVPTEQGS